MMEKAAVRVSQIQRAVMSLCDYIDKNMENRVSWLDLTEEQLWLMLVSCILGSRVASEIAEAFTERLSLKGLLRLPDILREPQRSEEELTKELSAPLLAPSAWWDGRRYQYPRSRSRFIVATAARIYRANGTGLKGILESVHDEFHARELLGEVAVGIGYKQASLFLRNALFSRELAILDTHVIRYMALAGLIDSDGSQPVRLTKEKYLDLERGLREYANAMSRPMSSLDLAIWAVMKLVQRRFRICP
ncbi:MAG: hypothetical protein ACE5JA_08620 [bacterium]